MSSLLCVRIRKDACFKWQFSSRRSHVDYVRDIAYEIMDRYSRRYTLYNDKAKQIVFRVASYISSDPHRTSEAITQYFGYGRYINKNWDIDNYNFNPLIGAEHYTRLCDRYEVDVNKGRLTLIDALADAYIDHKNKYGKYPKGSNNICGVCNKKGSNSNINTKWGLYGWNKDNRYSGCHHEAIKKSTLCVSCWNKLKAIQKKEEEAREIKRLSNKLNRERLKWLKSQTQVN